MDIIQVQQNTDEWLELRRSKLTGSKLKDIIVKRGNGKKIGFWQLVADRLAVNSQEDPIDRGHKLEDEAIQEFEKATGKTVERVGLCVSSLHPDIAISPDGLVKDEAGNYTEGVEVKCLSSARHLEAYFTKQIPGEYEGQIAQYFIVCPTIREVHVVFYDDRVTAKPYFTLSVTRDDYNKEIAFYQDYELRVLAEVDQLVESLMF